MSFHPYYQMSKSNKDLLDELMALTIEELLTVIKSGEASPATLNVARQMLRDNQITCTLKDSSPLSELVEVLPFDEYATDTREAKGL
jgi:hypothetical protein